MGTMNAMGHLLVAQMDEGIDSLWDLAEELCERRGLGGYPGCHGFSPVEREEHDLPRYCFHPTGAPDFELRGDDLRDLLVQGCTWLAQQIPEAEMWRRD